MHQEDFCQALALPSSAKYEREGGPSFLDCVEVVRDHSVDPLSDERRSFDGSSSTS